MYKKIEKYKGEIWEYCRLNDISDIDAFVFQCFKQGYDIKKYGFLGNTVVEVKEVEVIKEVEKPTEIIKEVIVEKEIIKEVPVDKIVEVIVEKEIIKEVEKPVEVIVEKEVIKEIPVDRIIEKEIIKEVIKEVPVDKIVEVIKEVEVEKIITKTEYISDKSGEDELLLKIQQLNEEVNTLRQTPPIEIIKEVEKPIEVIIEKEVIKEIPVDRVVEVIKEVPIDKIVEVIKEVPVDRIVEKEIIKEIEVIKEIPVDKIIEVEKEVVVEKEVIKEVVDEKTKEKIGLLQQTLQKLRQENNDKDVEINKLNGIINELEDGLKRTGAVFLKGSNINDKM